MLCSRGRTGSLPTATSRTRSARTGSRSPRRITSSRSTSSHRPRRSMPPLLRARASRSRSAIRARSRHASRRETLHSTSLPAELVTAIVTELGVHRAPYGPRFRRFCTADRDRRRSRDRVGSRALRLRRAPLRVAARTRRSRRAFPLRQRRPGLDRAAARRRHHAAARSARRAGTRAHGPQGSRRSAGARSRRSSSPEAWRRVSAVSSRRS